MLVISKREDSGTPMISRRIIQQLAQKCFAGMVGVRESRLYQQRTNVRLRRVGYVDISELAER